MRGILGSSPVFCGVKNVIDSSSEVKVEWSRDAAETKQKEWLNSSHEVAV